MQGTTADGLGLMFGVNHLGHFLLTNLLLDRLKECGPSRIVNVSSKLYQFGSLDFNLLSARKEFGTGNSFIDVFKIYSNSKLCNVLFTHELAKRLQGTSVTCYSLHPGQYPPPASWMEKLSTHGNILPFLLYFVHLCFRCSFKSILFTFYRGNQF